MTVRAITPADYPTIVATWESQRIAIGKLAPNLPYSPWTVASVAAFLPLTAASFMDDSTESFCALTFDQDYEVVAGITDEVSFGGCFRSCALILPDTSLFIHGSSPSDGPRRPIAWLTARFPNPVFTDASGKVVAKAAAGGVTTWRATVAQVLSKI